MKFLAAIGVSVGLHALLAAALAGYLNYSAKPTTLAQLDLSSVELSFAEKEEVTAAVSPSPAAPKPENQPEPEIKAPTPPTPPEPEKIEPPPPTEANPPKPEVSKLEPPRPEPKIAETPKPKPKPKLEQEPKNEPEKKPAPAASAPAPAVAPKQARIDADPKPKKTIRPNYPRSARARGEQGDVTLEIRVNKRGGVDRVTVVKSCGFPELDEAAVKAAKSAKFIPAKSSSKSVDSTARLTLKFELK